MRTPVVAVALAVLLLGCGSTTEAEPAAERVVEREVEVEVERIVEVEVIPQACLDALDDARELMDINSEFAFAVSVYPDIVMDAAMSGMGMDVAGIEEVTAQMQEVTAKVEALSERIQANTFNINAGLCEGS
jgi:outer membrane murein-binding lipoprotein Lpp